MFKKFFLFCILLLIIYCHKDNLVSASGDNQQTAEDKWVGKTDMPTAKGYFCGAEVNGKIYVFGGILDLSFNNSDAVEVYDLEKDFWTSKNKMPQKMFGQAAALDGKIYIFGGRKGDLYNGTTLNYNYLYDPDADSWTRKKDMPSSRAFMTVSVVNGKMYTIGGSLKGFEGCNIVQMYEPTTDTWTDEAKLPSIRLGQTANVYNSKIYTIGGGTSATDGAGIAFPYFDVYDPFNNLWESKENLTQSRVGHGSGLINNKLYICGGFSSNTELSDLIEYDFNSNLWSSKTSLATSRRMFVTCVYNDKFFILGGVTGTVGSQRVLKSVMMYTPPAASN